MKNQVIVRLTQVSTNCVLPVGTHFDGTQTEYLVVTAGSSLLVECHFTIQVHGVSPLIGIKYDIGMLDPNGPVNQIPKYVRGDFKYAPFKVENGRMRWTTTGISMDSGTRIPGPLQLEVNDEFFTRLTATAVRAVGPEQSIAVSFMSVDPSKWHFGGR